MVSYRGKLTHFPPPCGYNLLLIERNNLETVKWVNKPTLGGNTSPVKEYNMIELISSAVN